MYFQDTFFKTSGHCIVSQTDVNTVNTVLVWDQFTVYVGLTVLTAPMFIPTREHVAKCNGASHRCVFGKQGRSMARRTKQYRDLALKNC